MLLNIIFKFYSGYILKAFNLFRECFGSLCGKKNISWISNLLCFLQPAIRSILYLLTNIYPLLHHRLITMKLCRDGWCICNVCTYNHFLFFLKFHLLLIWIVWCICNIVAESAIIFCILYFIFLHDFSYSFNIYQNTSFCYSSPFPASKFNLI